MRNAGLDRRDARGLMPLADARAEVRRHDAFRKGEGRMVGGSWVLDSDRLWAALLSLSDAEEFVGKASRLAWYFHPRDRDNIATVERYGEAVLPWLARFVDGEGRLVTVPWCIPACLLAIGTPACFELVWSVKAIDDRGTSRQAPGPFASDSPGDVDAQGPVAPVPVGPGPSNEANRFLLTWVDRHPAVGMPALVERWQDGDEPRARLALYALHQSDPDWTGAALRDSLGADRAEALLSELAD